MVTRTYPAIGPTSGLIRSGSGVIQTLTNLRAKSVLIIAFAAEI